MLLRMDWLIGRNVSGFIGLFSVRWCGAWWAIAKALLAFPLSKDPSVTHLNMYCLFHASSHWVLLAFLITIYLLLLACHAGSPFLLLLESQTLLPFRRLLYVCSLKRLCCLVALLTSHLRDIFCLQYQEWVCLREIHNTAGTHMNLHCPEVKDIAANGSSQCPLKIK